MGTTVFETKKPSKITPELEMSAHDFLLWGQNNSRRYPCSSSGRGGLENKQSLGCLSALFVHLGKGVDVEVEITKS